MSTPGGLPSKVPGTAPERSERRSNEEGKAPMASTTTRLATFSFHHYLNKTHSWKQRSKTSLPCSFYGHKLPISTHSSQKPDRSPFTVSSIDLSKEDKLPTVPLSEDDSSGAGDSPLDSEEAAPAVDEGGEQSQQNFDPRRMEERFAVLNTGIYECRSCGYRYNEATGDPTYPLPPGYQFSKLPDDWRCPTCGAAQSFFESKSVEIAGFAQNQQYGLGGNTLTPGQKTLLIYGSLLFAFALFLSGYFLQ